MSHLDFEHTQEQLKITAGQILETSLKLGATSAQIEINESIETSVDVLQNNIESFETSYSTSLALYVYIGHNRGCVGISQVSPNNINEIIARALDIAKYTQADLHNGIAEEKLLCRAIGPDLGLFNPLDISNQDLIEKAKNIEALGLKASKQITASDGAAVSYGQYNFILANTNGLNLGYKTTRYASSVSLIGENQSGMQTDSWYDGSRDFGDLLSDELLAKTAVYRTIRRLNKGQIKSGKYPVIFESGIAKSLIGNYLAAVNGNNLFRRLSFLNDSMGQQIFPTWVNISEDPFVFKGSSSCYFDSEGVTVARRDLVKNGVVSGYLLNCYTARKLGLTSTGNAGGSHNVLVGANFDGDITQMAKTLTKGLIIIETIGHGVNMVSGDYSVGASGLWVENGAIQFFVDNITISGNLKQIYKNIQYISNDYSAHSSILCGSVLVDGINVSV